MPAKKLFSKQEPPPKRLNSMAAKYAKNKGAGDLALLREQIRTEKPARVYLFHGDEPFLIDYYIGELKKLILGGDTQGLNYSVFEDRVDINALIDACDTFPIFAEKKMVLVKNSSLFQSKSKKSPKASENDEEQEPGKSGSGQSSDLGSRAQELLKKYIPEIPETTCLVFVESQADKRLGAYKQVAKHGLALEFPRQKPEELVPWVIKGFRTMNKSVSREAAEYLVAVCEPDMYALRNEIFKIGAYAGERKGITLDDIKLMVTPTIKSAIFDLLDAVAERNAPRALKLLDEMLSIKEPEQKILAMLAKQTGEILKLKYLIKSGASQAQVSRYFQGKHPYAMKIMADQARRMDEEYLRKLMKSCMEAETSYKRGLMGARLSLEVLISKIGC